MADEWSDLVDEKRSWRGKAGFLCYCILMLWLLYGQRVGDRTDAPYMEQLMASINLEPFRTIRNYLSVAQWTQNTALLQHIVVNLVGNVVMFIPLGYFLPLYWRRFRSFFRMIWDVMILIWVIEVVQLVTLLGSLDIDDLILNLAGTAIGYFIWRIRRGNRS